MRSRRRTSPAGQGFCLVAVFCLASLAWSELALDGPESSNNGTREGRIAAPLLKEASTVQEYLSFISNPPIQAETPISRSPPEQIPSTASESQASLHNGNDLTLGSLVEPVDDADLDLSIPGPSDEVLVANSPVTSSSPDPLPIVGDLVESVAGEDAPLQAPIPPSSPSDNNVPPSVGNNSARANESGTSEVHHDDIPSFSEWTQKVLAEEEKSGANGSASMATPAKVSSSVKLRQKNYASPDCGAKILAANSEAEHTSAILDPARDEYFLSICSAKIWFVIELCEAIQAQRVEIANFELFSSSPKDFRVFISDRYPTRDWALLGQFTAADERSIQSFPLERQLFGKFVKVELVSHYGKEHFCPISLFRVFGNSEYEVLDIEDSRSGSASTSEEGSTEEEMLYDLTTNRGSDNENQLSLSEKGSKSGRNLFGSAKDAVISIVKKAAEALGSPQQQNTAEPGVTKESEATAEVTAEKDDIARRPGACHTAVESANVSRAINGSLSCQWEELTFLASQDWLHPHLMQLCWSESSDVTYYSPELIFSRAVWGASTIQALCYWISPEEYLDDMLPPSPFELVFPLPSSGLSGEVDMNLTPPETLADSDCQPSDLPSDFSPDSDNLEEFVESNEEEEEVNGISTEDMMKLALVVPEPAIKTDSPPPQQPPQLQQQQQLQQLQKPSQQQQQHQKESVFVRLSNRIKVLERNMSLSGQYLEELSRRYKRQVDDMQKALNRTLQTLNETLQRMNAQDERHQATLNQLDGDIKELKSSTERLAKENLNLKAELAEQHFFLMMIEVGVVITVVLYLLRRQNRLLPAAPPPSQVVRTGATHRRVASASAADFRLEVGQKVQEVMHNNHRELKQSSLQSSLLMLDVSEAPRGKGQHPSKASPAPSLADSSSSGCESAFSFPSSNHAASRDPSPVNESQCGRVSKGKTGAGGNGGGGGFGNKKNKKKSKAHHGQHLPSQQSVARVYHLKDIKSSPPPPPKMRLKPENPEWQSRAKILAAEFIKENCEANAMRSSV